MLQSIEFKYAVIFEANFTNINVYLIFFIDFSLVLTQGSPYSLYLYDCMWLYLLAVNESLNEGLDPRNGTLIFEKSRNRIFEGKRTI